MYLENVQKYKNNQSAVSPKRDSLPNALLVDLLAKERVGVEQTQGTKNVLAQRSQHTNQTDHAAAAA